jgi:hypothetical protein
MPNEIHLRFIKVYGDSSPLFSTIKKWAAKFKRGRTSLKDDLLEGCQFLVSISFRYATNSLSSISSLHIFYYSF